MGGRRFDKLVCVIRRRPVAATPEERVRQAFLRRLLEVGYPLSALQVEYSLGEAGRFDVAAFTKEGAIWLLAECKRAEVAKAPIGYWRMAIQHQLVRYAQALARWPIYHVAFVIGPQVYCYEFKTRQWLPSLPLYPR